MIMRSPLCLFLGILNFPISAMLERCVPPQGIGGKVPICIARKALWAGAGKGSL